MRVELLLPALTEAKSPFFRPIKYSLFPPLGLATLAGYLDPDDEVRHPGRARRGPRPRAARPTSWGSRSTSPRPAAPTRSPTATARAGRHVVLGGLHVTALPEEAARHADTIVLGPAEEAWPALPRRLPRRPRRSASTARARGRSPACRPCAATSSGASSTSCPTRSSSRGAAPTPAPSATRTASSRAGGPSTSRRWTRRSPRSSGSPAATSTSSTTTSSATPRFAAALFDGMRGMGRLWQAAGTVDSVLRPGLLEKAVGVRPAEPLRRLRDARARTASARRASGRTSGGTTPPPSGGSTTSASW